MLKVSVGILLASTIRFSISGESDTVSYADGKLLWHGNKYEELSFSPEQNGSFTLYDVVIGIGFHWQRKENQTFQGSLRFIVEQGQVRAINDIDIEDYLLSVISSEMSGSASMEFLKAHAVISRSWLVNRMLTEKNSSDTISYVTRDRIIRWYDHDDHTNFDVCADDHCQRYQGISRAQEYPERWEKVQQVINATRGQILTYDGKVCDARFSKCCGGKLELYESCWDDNHHPYLISKDDPYCNTNDKRILAQVLNGYDQETADFYRWTVEYSVDEISELISRKSGINIGQLIDLVPIKRGQSERIIELQIIGSERTITVGKELEIRKWLSETHLYSSAFTVEKTPHSFILHGKGWGHGVGLCQIGAAVMGDQGFTYTDILQHYYPNTVLESKIRKKDNLNVNLNLNENENKLTKTKTKTR